MLPFNLNKFEKKMNKKIGNQKTNPFFKVISSKTLNILVRSPIKIFPLKVLINIKKS